MNKAKAEKLFYKLATPEEKQGLTLKSRVEIKHIEKQIKDIAKLFAEQEKPVDKSEIVKAELLEIIKNLEIVLSQRITEAYDRELPSKLNSRLTKHEKEVLKDINAIRKMVLEVAQHGGSMYPTFQEEFPNTGIVDGVNTTFTFPHAVNDIYLEGQLKSILNGDYIKNGAYGITLTFPPTGSLPINKYF